MLFNSLIFNNFFFTNYKNLKLNKRDFFFKLKLLRNYCTRKDNCFLTKAALEELKKQEKVARKFEFENNNDNKKKYKKSVVVNNKNEVGSVKSMYYKMKEDYQLKKQVKEAHTLFKNRIINDYNIISTVKKSSSIFNNNNNFTNKNKKFNDKKEQLLINKLRMQATLLSCNRNKFKKVKGRRMLSFFTYLDNALMLKSTNSLNTRFKLLRKRSNILLNRSIINFQLNIKKQNINKLFLKYGTYVISLNNQIYKNKICKKFRYNVFFLSKLYTCLLNSILIYKNKFKFKKKLKKKNIVNYKNKFKFKKKLKKKNTVNYKNKFKFKKKLKKKNKVKKNFFTFVNTGILFDFIKKKKILFSSLLKHLIKKTKYLYIYYKSNKTKKQKFNLILKRLLLLYKRVNIYFLFFSKYSGDIEEGVSTFSDLELKRYGYINNIRKIYKVLNNIDSFSFFSKKNVSKKFFFYFKFFFFLAKRNSKNKNLQRLFFLSPKVYQINIKRARLLYNKKIKHKFTINSNKNTFYQKFFNVRLLFFFTFFKKNDRLLCFCTNLKSKLLKINRQMIKRNKVLTNFFFFYNKLMFFFFKRNLLKRSVKKKKIKLNYKKKYSTEYNKVNKSKIKKIKKKGGSFLKKKKSSKFSYNLSSIFINSSIIQFYYYNRIKVKKLKIFKFNYKHRRYFFNMRDKARMQQFKKQGYSVKELPTILRYIHYRLNKKIATLKLRKQYTQRGFNYELYTTEITDTEAVDTADIKSTSNRLASKGYIGLGFFDRRVLYNDLCRTKQLNFFKQLKQKRQLIDQFDFLLKRKKYINIYKTRFIRNKFYLPETTYNFKYEKKKTQTVLEVYLEKYNNFLLKSKVINYIYKFKTKIDSISNYKLNITNYKNLYKLLSFKQCFNLKKDYWFDFLNGASLRKMSFINKSTGIQRALLVIDNYYINNNYTKKFLLSKKHGKILYFVKSFFFKEIISNLSVITSFLLGISIFFKVFLHSRIKGLNASFVATMLKQMSRRAFPLKLLYKHALFLMRKHLPLRGYRLEFSGRFFRRERALYVLHHFGFIGRRSKVTLLDYCWKSLVMKFGVSTIKVWIHKYEMHKYFDQLIDYKKERSKHAKISSRINFAFRPRRRYSRFVPQHIIDENRSKSSIFKYSGQDFSVAHNFLFSGYKVRFLKRQKRRFFYFNFFKMPSDIKHISFNFFKSYKLKQNKKNFYFKYLVDIITEEKIFFLDIKNIKGLFQNASISYIHFNIKNLLFFSKKQKLLNYFINGACLSEQNDVFLLNKSLQNALRRSYKKNYFFSQRFIFLKKWPTYLSKESGFFAKMHVNYLRNSIISAYNLKSEWFSNFFISSVNLFFNRVIKLNFFFMKEYTHLNYSIGLMYLPGINLIREKHFFFFNKYYFDIYTSSLYNNKNNMNHSFYEVYSEDVFNLIEFLRLDAYNIFNKHIPSFFLKKYLRFVKSNVHKNKGYTPFIFFLIFFYVNFIVVFNKEFLNEVKVVLKKTYYLQTRLKLTKYLHIVKIRHLRSLFLAPYEDRKKKKKSIIY